MADDVNRQVLLAARPTGKLDPSHFAFREAPMPEPGSDEVLVRTLYLSLDAANRAWMSPVATYTKPVEIGGVMDGFTVCEVVRSNDAGFRPGDIVEGAIGWQEFGVAKGADLHKLSPIKPLSHWLSGLGVTAKTAYFGLLDIGKPAAGETVVVSAAAGAVGSVVGQIARLKGCRAVGIAGGPEKCAWLTAKLGFDAAIDYKAEKLGPALRAACPDGIDVYFDNTGGPALEAALFAMNQNGRVVCCGVVSQYDTANPEPGPRGVPGLIVVKRLTMRGFIVLDYDDRREAAEAELAEWIGDGLLKIREDIIDGLDNAPAALIGLLAGENFGKRMIRVAPEPE